MDLLTARPVGPASLGRRRIVLMVAALSVAMSWIVPSAPAGATHLPDGPVGRIVYSGDTTSFSVTYLFTMAPDGSDVQRLTPTVCVACGDIATDAHARWSPDGSTVAFDSDREVLTSTTHVYTIRSNGKGFRRLTEKGSNFRPVWSPTGGALAFESTRTGNYDVFVMAPDGSGEANVSKHAALDRSPTWAPDGEQLAFISHRDGDWDVYVVNTDGTGLVNVSNNAVDDASPAWSPDGTLIAFSSLGDDHDISVATPDGSSVVPIAETVGVHEMFPTWSPDSSRIAFRIDQSNPTLAVMDADGGNREEIAGWYADDTSAIGLSWSADGTRIVYGNSSEILAVDADGTDPAALRFGPGDTFRFPDWQALHVSVEVSRSTIDFGRAATVTGHLHWFGSTDNLEISIYRRPAGGSLKLLATETVDGTGDLTVPVEPTSTTTYLATWAGDAAHGATSSGTVAIQVRVLVRTRVSGNYGRSGDWFLFHEGDRVRQRGTVIPDHSGDRLIFEAQVRRNGKWRDLDRAGFRIGSGGSVVAFFDPGRGSFRVHNVFKGDADHAGSTSRWVLVRVTS